MGPRLCPVLGAFAREIFSATTGRGLFLAATPDYFRKEGGAFVRYRLSPLAVIRHAAQAAMRTFLSEMRGGGGVAPSFLPEMLLIMHLLSHIPPHLAKHRLNASDPPYAELALPERIRSYSTDLPSL